ncbi:MAG: AcvB/VirJ family lysyl-phosphatidylglycerol hydrolase [Ginsengibacter sp.]|jgi:type IV secretory pathway VirJ component
MKYFLLLSIFSISISFGFTQNFPVKEWTASAHNKPLIFYISGDGGFNKFSTSLCQSLNDKGFDVVALNAKSYFWDKKTPVQTAIDIDNYLNKKIAGRQNQQIAFIGYSFGADVLPFILNRVSKYIHDKVLVSVIMGSSGSTDFEIHFSDMFSSSKKRSMDVISEINKITDGKLIILSGGDDQDLNLKKITYQKYTSEVIPGGHHFDGDTGEVARIILKYI